MALNLSTAVVVVATVGLAAGCHSDVQPTASPATGDFAAAASGALSQAEAVGASQAQIDAIREAIADGDVAFESVRSATEATFDCFEDAGVRYEDHGSRLSAGIPYVDYVYEAGAKEAAADKCMEQNSLFIETLYALQPRTLEAKDAAFTAAMPLIIDCLRGFGYEVDDSITADELKSMIPLQEWEEDDPGGLDAAGERVSCLRDTGVDGW